MVRIIAKNYKTGAELYQVPYYLDKLKQEPQNNFNEAAVGLAEILVINKDLLLTLKRTGIKTGENFQYDFDCRMFLVIVVSDNNFSTELTTFYLLGLNLKN